MRRTLLVLVVLVAAVLALVAALPAGRVIAQELTSVVVTNWPDIFQVRGEVTVSGGPIRQAELVLREPVTIPPFISPREVNRLISGGTLELDRYPAVVLSLVGQTKGQVGKPGSVGAILLPDVETVQEAYDQRGEFLFPLEVAAASVAGSSPFFASTQPRYALAFPRYRVLFYNTSDRTVTVNLFAYLTQ